MENHESQSWERIGTVNRLLSSPAAAGLSDPAGRLWTIPNSPVAAGLHNKHGKAEEPRVVTPSSHCD
jgi:hypothetical protein